MSSSLRVKSRFMLQLAVVCVMLLVFALPAFAQTPEPNQALGDGSITLPADLAKDYSIATAEAVSFSGLDGNYLAVGYVAKEFSMENPKPSFLVIYKESDTGYDKVFRYLPVAPSDYPMPLTIEKMWPVTIWDANGNGTTFLVTSWGEVGADYWGTHPIVLAYENNDFRAVPLYKGNLADNPQIKGFDWTSPDFEVDNFFHPGASKVNTILTQGVDVNGSKVVLTFWGDNECKACEHKIVNIEIDLSQQ